jgi:hypothetical protein
VSATQPATGELALPIGDEALAVRLRGRLAGVHVEPSDAPLQVGAGGRDGDSVALDVLLRLRLEAGSDFPA